MPKDLYVVVIASDSRVSVVSYRGNIYLSTSKEKAKGDFLSWVMLSAKQPDRPRWLLVTGQGHFFFGWARMNENSNNYGG